MRILILANNDVGLYKFRKELLIELLKQGEVIISLPYGEFVDRLVDLGFRFIDTPMNRRGMDPIHEITLLRRYLSILSDIRPDVVLTYTIKPNVYGGWACQQKRIPYIANVTGLGTSIENGGLLSLITTTLYRIGLQKAHCVFFQNSENRKLFMEKKLIKGTTRLLPGSGVELHTNCYEPYPSDDQGFRFLFVGRIMKDKGIGEFLDAMRRIHAEQGNVTADIVGGCDEDYSALLHAAEAEGAIRYHDQQPDVHPFYANSHCVVLPSYHEGTSNVMLEASAAGRPVITTRVPGCRETFDEGVTGLGCEAKSAESLLNAMLEMLSLSHEQRETMGRAARAKMEREFDRQIVISAYLEEIESIKKDKQV